MTVATRKRTFELVADAVAARGIDTFFGVMGDGNLPVLRELVDTHGLRYVAARREEGAVAMADGYARVSGRTGLCTVTMGPGLTNALTGLTEAVRNHTPLVLIAGIAPAGMQHPQELDHHALARTAGAEVLDVLAPCDAGPVVAEAFRRTRARRRPVLVAIAADALHAVAPGDLPLPPDGRGLAGEHLRAQRVRPDPATVAEVAALLGSARRPVILAGRGAVESGAGPVLQRLADQVGAVLCTSLLAKGLFSGSPRSVGVSGGYASSLARKYLGAADLVVAFGAGLNGWTTRRGTMFGQAQVVHVDVDPDAPGRWFPATALLGDARVTAEQLCDALAAAGTAGPGYPEAQIARIATFSLREEFDDASTPEHYDLQAFALDLDAVLPRDRTLAVDCGHFTSVAASFLSVARPRSFVFAVQFGSMGLALGASVGACLATSDEVTVAVVGDGGLMMSLPEIDTAVRESLPLLVVVMNDGQYGAEAFLLEQHGWDVGLARFATPDFAAVARSLGAAGTVVRTRADLAAVEEWLGAPAGPLVVDVRLDPDVYSAWMTSSRPSPQRPADEP